MVFFFGVRFYIFGCQGTEAFVLKTNTLLKAGHSISEATSPLSAGNNPNTWFKSCLQEPGSPMPRWCGCTAGLRPAACRPARGKPRAQSRSGTYSSASIPLLAVPAPRGAGGPHELLLVSPGAVSIPLLLVGIAMSARTSRENTSPCSLSPPPPFSRGVAKVFLTSQALFSDAVSPPPLRSTFMFPPSPCPAEKPCSRLPLPLSWPGTGETGVWNGTPVP